MSDLPGVYKPLSEADTETRHVLNRPTPARFDREYPYVAPPGSDHTLHELDYLISLIPLREKWGALIKEADEDMEGLFLQLCGDLGVPCDEADLRRRTREAAILITKLKWRYNRPRPYQVAAKHGRLAGQGSVWKEGDFSVLDSVSAHTPAYPSGHTIQAKLLASYLSEIAPQHRKAFMGLADNISFSRVVAGYHWPSDVSYGEDVFRHMAMPDMPSSVRVAARKTSRREILDKTLIQRFRKDILALARAADKARTLQDAQQVSAAANRWGAHFDSFTATLRKDLEDRRRSAERDYHREFNPTPPALDDVEYYLDRGGLEKMWNLDIEVRRIPSGRIELKNRGGGRWKPPEQVREELLQFWLDRGDTAGEAEIKVDDYLLRRPSWTREEAEAHAVAKWKEEARKWARRVRDKARPVWPRLEQLAEWMEGRRGGKRSLEFITPEEEVVDLSGFRVVFRGFAESPYQDELPRLKEGLARFRRAAQARAPIILKRIVPIHIEWTFEPTSRGDAGAYYTRGMIYVTPWEIGKDMGRFVHVLAHEMGHHLYQTVLSGQATKEWDSFIRGTYTDLDLRDVLRRMEALGAKGLYFDKALREDPILYLQLEGLQQSRRELRNLMDADDVREYLDAGGDPNVRVMAMPISGYAHKNPQEAFCEALGKLVAYGPKAVPDVVLGMLRRVLPTVRISSDKTASHQFVDGRGPNNNWSRFKMLDPSGPDREGGYFFKDVYDWYGVSGRRLKRPRLVERKEPDPKTVAFIDYSGSPSNTYVHVIASRERGRGVMQKLLHEFYKRKLSDGGSVNWGRIMDPTAFHIFRKFALQYPRVRHEGIDLSGTTSDGRGRGWTSRTLREEFGSDNRKQAYVSAMPATEDCDAIVSAAWVSPQGKMVFLRGQTHEGFAEKWALRNEPDLHAQIVEHGHTARPHASIWHRVMLDRGWLQLQGMSSIVVPPRPSRKQLQNVADFFANCIADGTSDPDRITLHILGLDPSLRGKPIEPGEDRYPFDVQERVSLADFIEREASGPVIEDMYQAMMERTRRASLIEAWGPMYREARGCDVEHSWAWISPGGKLIEVDDHGDWGIEKFPRDTYEATLRDLSRRSFRERDPLYRKLLPMFLKAVVFDPDNWETVPEEALKKGQVYQIPEKTREEAERVGLPNLSEGSWGLRVRLTPAEERFLFQKNVFPEVVRVNMNNARNKRVRRLWEEERNSMWQSARHNASEVLHEKGWISASHWAALGGSSDPSPKQWESFFAHVLACWKKNGIRPAIDREKFYLASGKAYEEIPYEDAIERYCPRHLQDEIYEYLLSDSAPRTARGKAKKDVGHGGLDEWFSGHGGAKGKGEGATWGDWVAISPVTKTLPSGKKVEKGDIVGECGISDDPDWKEITKGGEDPLKCMPRSKAYDMGKKERAEKAKAKQKAEKADSSRGKKPTMTPTFDKPKKKASGIDRVFRSPKPFTGFRPVSGQGHDFKPKGLWYSCGSAWDDWCRYEMPSGITDAPYVYRIGVNLSRMIVIRNAEDFKDFESKYGVFQRGMMMIDWKEVARDYDGIEICPYQYRFRMSSMWYYGWDVASGCIWGSGAFKAVESLESCGLTERVASRKLANDAHKAQIALMKFLSDVARKHRVGDHVYVVGGAVRNFVIDRPIKDIDVVIDAVALGERFRKVKDSEWFANLLQGRIPVRTDLTTNQYGVAILTVKGDWILDGHNLNGEVIEIANARKESYGGEAGKGYKPDQVVPATIEEDLLRREFTFNTLLWRLQDLASGPEKAEIIDLTGCGLRDLNNMTMRCPRDPDIVFADDPTRMLRAIKFATKYGFKIPDDLAASIRKNAQKMKQAPWEAIATIFINNVLNEPTARTALKQMKALGLLDVVAEMVQEQKPFASYLSKQLRNRNVALLLDLLDLGLTNPTPLKFLTRDQQIQLREITVPMESGDADAFVAYLAKPQVDNGSLIRDFDLKGSSRSLPVVYAREALLENPDLMGNRAALDAAIRDLFRAKGTSRQASLSDLWGHTLLGAEAIPGGKARGMKPTDFDSDELDAGIEVEHEHLVGGGYSKEDARAKAREIAMDHLAEIPDYYTRLDAMESAAGVKHAGLSAAWGKTLEENEYLLQQALTPVPGQKQASKPTPPFGGSADETLLDQKGDRFLWLVKRPTMRGKTKREWMITDSSGQMVFIDGRMAGYGRKRDAMGAWETVGKQASKKASTNTERYYYKATDGKWYVANEEYEEDWETGEQIEGEMTHYGPFPSFDAAEKYMRRNFANSGSYSKDDRGKARPPRNPVKPGRSPFNGRHRSFFGSGAPTAEGAFYKDPRKSEVREFAETKAISNDPKIVEQAAPELDVPESKAIQEAEAAPPTPIEIAKEPGGGAVSTLNRYVVETEDPAAEPAAIENQKERVGEAGVKEASVSPLDLERFAARIERLQRTRTHGWNPADGLEFKNMLPGGRGHRRLPDPKKLREIARDTPFSDEDSRFVSSNWRNWMTWALRAEGLIRDNDPRNPRRMMRDMARGRFPGGR